ncbi:hypothetical protein [Kosakonia sacchari]|uniref:hypothetical protein n=1 Tax=Kosakonia sacchari TaxID=1158459 RepID=UPI0011DF55C0|nr:hypothetical protein [Kosakonia sacchari]
MPEKPPQCFDRKRESCQFCHLPEHFWQFVARVQNATKGVQEPLASACCACLLRSREFAPVAGFFALNGIFSVEFWTLLQAMTSASLR